MRSGSEASTWATPPVWSPQMLRCAQHDTSEGLFHSMTHPGHFFIACRKKATLTCHAERQRSIWFHQPGGMAHLGFFAALRMTCPGHFFMDAVKKAPSRVMLSGSEASGLTRRAAWPTSDSSLRSE